MLVEAEVWNHPCGKGLGCEKKIQFIFQAHYHNDEG